MLKLKLIDKVVPSEVKLLAKWRKKVQPIWHETFKVTNKGTAIWLEKILKNPDIKLYFVVKDGKIIGHVGYHIIDGEFYIDNIIRGTGKSDGSMTNAILKIMKLNKNKFTYLLTGQDMLSAISFYEKIGFEKETTIGVHLRMRLSNLR